ncbi:MAG TPA: hypothetical protein VFO06_00675 [Gemmatimonadales bacterium]|nr:hypothetical protein [Gemmatimonadales bacterium]
MRRLAVLLGTLVAAPVAAQAPTPVLTLLPPFTRSAALAGAGVALVGDAGSVFINPSGLATIKVLSLEGGYSHFPDGSIYAQGAAAFRVEQFNFGGGIQYLNFSDTSAVADNLTWGASAVYRYGLIAIGASGRYVSVEDTTGGIDRTFTGDGGVTIAFFDIMALALSVQNIGSRTLSGEGVSLPTTTHFGYTLNFVDPQGTARALGTIEVVWTEGQGHRTLYGVEGGVVLKGVGLVGRVGYGLPPEGSEERRWTFGGGVVLGRLGLDYAYQEQNLFGKHIHRLGLRLTP